tara:strand:+ start:440 stop:763 length:324 start_codon:yes stop_codon:yes gene_type:complete
MAEERAPKIPLKEIHEILSIEMRDFRYLILAVDKDAYDEDKNTAELNIVSNIKREEMLLLLEDLLLQMKEGTAYEASTSSEEQFKQQFADKKRFKQTKRKNNGGDKN